MKTRAELKTLAKEQMKPCIWKLILCIVVMELIVAVPSGILGALELGQFSGIISLIFTGPFSLGLTWIFLGITRNEEPTVGKLFEGFSYFKNSFLLSLLMGIFIFLWSLLLIIPGIIKTLSYSMAFFILAENPEMSAKEAIDQSKAMMEGHKMDLFVLQLSFIPWVLLSIITCGIASFYVVPYVQATYTNFYLDLKNQPVIVETTNVE